MQSITQKNALAEKGISDHNVGMDEEEFRRQSKALIKEKMPHIPDEHIELHQESTYYWGPENFSQASDWLGATVEILEKPDRFSNRELFINFFGVIDDSELPFFLREKAVGSFAIFGYTEAEFKKVIENHSDKEIKTYFQLIWQAKDLFDPIYGQFSSEEKFLLRFLRHRHCHVTLGNFSVKIEGQGEEAKFKVTNWKQLSELSRKMTVEDFRNSLLAKLQPNVEAFKRINYLLNPQRGKPRLFPE